ncbi:hypothetical protein CFC21_004780 [Triticum aestivum]|uniref:O-methyltransferase domain-containing protein n=2 Tax=Triticum aestivum TaxID=4565 RepID=A0A9R1D889_WHEAT|nr:acetylserotonin O-methyltransferase 1-like [Triticum aestivum]KAF6987100.1 hypothetical protein CFC21_004780 [Triticum aestivum]
MEPAVRAEDEAMSTEELLQAQTDLYHHSLAYIKSMALGAATELGVADAIHGRGGAITLSHLAAATGVHPTKVQHFGRLMRALTVTGVFTSEEKEGGGGALYKLTRISRLLVGVGKRRLSPMVRMLVSEVSFTTPMSICEWITTDTPARAMFEAHFGSTQNGLWEKEDAYGAPFYSAMSADSRVVMEVLLRECSSVFEAVAGSLVDVGGGSGGVVAAAIATAFPHIKCSVLDLPNVVAAADDTSNVQFVSGDMFDYIPPADAVLLKWILHDWEDQDCVKILRKCREAITTRGAGGKVIIIDFVVGAGSSKETETQVLFDLYMMMENGAERDEHEWSKIFFEAGFSDYKIMPVLGARSLIQVFP